ncbi:hypothetical protein [Nocardia sp. NPDC060259]|uniref:hypothetical protein n=1 Tax=Nocardia sp. NPDC060259 TaxID=3347088 RepID=UPI003648B4EA
MNELEPYELSVGRRVALTAASVVINLLAVAAIFAFFGGVLAVIIGGVALAQEDSDAPEPTVPMCDGEPMTTDTLCITFQNGKAFKQTYPDKMRELQEDEDDGVGTVVAGGASIVGGLAVIMVARYLNPRIDRASKSPAAEVDRPAPTPSSSARPMPVPPPPVEAVSHDYRALLTLVMGSSSTAERLIDYERRMFPGLDRQTLIAKAIDRLLWERQRHS